MGGTKYDAGKTKLDLVPPELIEEVGKVLTFGAEKYNPDDWRGFKKEDFPRLRSAAMRHFEAYRKGEYLDEESGLPHLAHAATNLAFLIALDKPEVTLTLGELEEQTRMSVEYKDLVLKDVK